MFATSCLVVNMYCGKPGHPWHSRIGTLICTELPQPNIGQHLCARTVTTCYAAIFEPLRVKTRVSQAADALLLSHQKSSSVPPTAIMPSCPSARFTVPASLNGPGWAENVTRVSEEASRSGVNAHPCPAPRGNVINTRTNPNSHTHPGQKVGRALHDTRPNGAGRQRCSGGQKYAANRGNKDGKLLPAVGLSQIAKE